MKEFFANHLPVLQILITVGLGVVLGLRSELDAQTEGPRKRDVLGVRTTILLSLLGVGSTFFEALPWLPLLTFGGVFGLMGIVYAYATFGRGRRSLVPTLSALAMFVVGLLVGYDFMIPAILLTVVLVVLNEFKDELHLFISQLSIAETRGVLQLLIFTGVVLPFLPQEAIDPWGVLVPFNVWLLVMFISGMNFVGYFLIKHFGERGGILLTSFLGALASSTAVTVSLAEQSENRRVHDSLLVTATLVAMSVMELRVMLVWGLLGPIEARNTFLFVPLSMAMSSLVMAWIYLKRSDRKKHSSHKLKVTSPFELWPAFKFGILFVVVLLAIALGQEFFGDRGVIVAAFLSGLADIDAVVLSSIEAVRSGELLLSLAETAIFVGLLVNTLVKLGYVGIFGSRSFLKKLLPSVLITAIVGSMIFVIS